MQEGGRGASVAGEAAASGRRAHGGAALVVFVAVLAVGATGAVPSVAAAACPNEPRRAEQSVSLPECRAYELVTPPDKGSGQPAPKIFESLGGQRESEPLSPDSLSGAPGPRAALDGERIGWVSQPMRESLSPGVSHISTRTPAGWTTQGLVPPMSPLNELVCAFQMGVSGWSANLDRAILDLPAGPPQGFSLEPECGHPEPRLVDGEPKLFRNLYMHDNLGGGDSLVNVTPADVPLPEPSRPGQDYRTARFFAGSDDLGHVVFTEELPLTRAAEETSPEVEEACENEEPGCWEGQNNLYEWTEGEVRLVTVLPDGSPVLGSLAGIYIDPVFIRSDLSIAQARHAVSADGQRIFFEAEGNLYLREDGERSVQVDEAEAGAPGPGGGGEFQIASTGGDRVFFTAEGNLTEDSTAKSGEPDLFEYDVVSEELTDLTVNPEPANVLGVAGASEDGSRVYFVATGDLGGGMNSNGDSAVAGEPNLYLAEGGDIAYIATLDETDDRCDWLTAQCTSGNNSSVTSRVSSGGDFLAFNSVRSITGYDNTHPESGEPLLEIYLYDAAADELSCASCIPTGAPPTAGAAIRWPSAVGNYSRWPNKLVQRNVSDSGQVFFETADALLPRDVNGRRDVYEYVDGELHMLSSGTGETGTYFIDATPDGDSVFMATAQRLLPRRDVDTVYDYYVARVGGGFPQPALSEPPCEGVACRGSTAEAPVPPSPGSDTFSGAGNLRRGCAVLAQRTLRLSRASKGARRRTLLLRRRARRTGAPARAQRLRRAARRQAMVSKRRAQRAQRLGQRTKQCRRAERRADR